ncbi:MAG: phosphoribosylglycinamide formyltransferase [Sandarakinorhabdus sp.]|nr:phosphoribosylglycinamide formyltransferase [Sandarakinorhabdus sp.]
MMPKPRLAILISGRGSNMVALAKAAQKPDYPAVVALVLSNRADAGGLETAARMGIETLALPHRGFATRADFDAALCAELKARRIDMIALAGFMRILTPGFIRQWEGRIVNIHPSLLPEYRGLDTHARALAAHDTEAGCTVHVVTERLDDGPILAQARVPILPDDCEATLAARVLEEEHRIYPPALARHIEALGLNRPCPSGKGC